MPDVAEKRFAELGEIAHTTATAPELMHGLGINLLGAEAPVPIDSRGALFKPAQGAPEFARQEGAS